MSTELRSIRVCLAEALFSGTDLADFNLKMLIDVFNILMGYLKNPAISSQLKLDFALQVFPDLLGIMAMPLWKKYLSERGHGGNLLIIYAEFCTCTKSFPSLLNQTEYEAAIKKLPSSNFPSCLQDLPDFLKVHLLDELKRLV